MNDIVPPTVVNSPMADWYNNLRVVDVFKAVGKHIAITTGILAIIWSISKPFIDQYISDAVAQEYATQKQVKALEDTLKDVESSIGIVTNKLPKYDDQFKDLQLEQERTKIIAAETRSLVRDSQEGIKELNVDVKMMLRDFRAVNNIPPYSNGITPQLGVRLEP